MARNRKHTTNRVKVKDETLQAAVEEVTKQNKSIRTVAEKYNITRTTLFRHVKKAKENVREGEIKVIQRRVPNKVFSAEQEEALKDYLITSSKMQYGLTTVAVRILAYEYASFLNLKMPRIWFENKKAGVDWFFSFMKRNPTLSVRTPEATSLARVSSFNKPAVDKFYSKLADVMTRYNFLPHRIWNVDETGCLTVGKLPNVVAEKGTKQIGQVTSGERGQLVTACCFINASGGFIPPVFVFPRVTAPEFLVAAALPGSLAVAHKTGWMTGPNFLKTMKHFIFHTNTTKDNPSLLLLDNHESHMTLEVIKCAKDNGVVMLTFPPHCSHRLQPLDVAVYFPFKKRYYGFLNDWMISHPGKKVTYHNVPALANKSFIENFTPKNIISGFAKSGIHPFNSENFSEDDFLSSYATDRPLISEV